MALPVAAIISIVLACWVVVVLILFALYQLLKSRGSCDCDCAPCGKEGGGGCCECCISIAETCNCCNPSVNGCLDSICPGKKKKVSCVDIILCQCCANEGEESCCLKICPCFGCESDCCSSDCCTGCVDCEAVTCCCLEIRLVNQSEKENTPPQNTKYTVTTKENNTNSASKPENKPKTSNKYNQKTKAATTKNKKSEKEFSKLDLSESTKSVSETISSVRSDFTVQSTPRSINTARSISQVNIVTKNEGKKKTPRTKKSNTSALSKTVSSNKRPSERPDVTKVSLTRSLPPIPPTGNRTDNKPKPTQHGAAASNKVTKRTKSVDDSSDLVEVPVHHGNVPLQLCSGGGTQTYQNINMAAYQHYTEQMYIPLTSSDLQYSAHEIGTQAHSGAGYNRSSMEEATPSHHIVSGQSLESLVPPGGRSLQSHSGSLRPRPMPTSCICDSQSEEDECGLCDCCCPASEEESADCCPSNCCQGDSREGCCHSNCCQGDSENSSCALCMPCKALRDCCKERFCSGESESADCALCKPCQYVSDWCREHCCNRDPEESCCVNCMGVICECWLCKMCGVMCSWVICCIEEESTETQLCQCGHNWECVCRPCDVFMCDCCPKCTQCHIMPFFCSREYPYCLDFCDCCRLCASLYDYLKTMCVTSCNSATESMCGCYITECWTDCCEVRSCCVCHCYTVKDCWDFCIEGINKRAAEARNKPQCCQKFIWCCLELRWKGGQEQTLKELAGDLCRRGYTLQVLDSLGTVVDPQFYREAILTQPLPSSTPSPDLGYTDSYGGYRNFPEYQKKQSHHQLARYTSTPTFGRRCSRVHSIPARMTRSLPVPTVHSNMGRRQHGHTEETILYNEKLQGSDNITDLGTPIASSTQNDPAEVSEDESERESRLRLQLARDRESEAKCNIKSNEEKIVTISKRLHDISVTRLDTSGLDTYYENITHKLSQSGIYPKHSREKSCRAFPAVHHGASLEQESVITTTPSRCSHRDIRKTLTREYNSRQDTKHSATLMSDTSQREGSRSNTRHSAGFAEIKHKTQSIVKDNQVQGPSSTSRRHRSGDKVRHVQSGSLQRQPSDKDRTDTVQNVRHDTLEYEDEVKTKPVSKRKRKKRLADDETPSEPQSRVSPAPTHTDPTDGIQVSNGMYKRQCRKTGTSDTEVPEQSNARPKSTNTDCREAKPQSLGGKPVSTDSHTSQHRRARTTDNEAQELSNARPGPTDADTTEERQHTAGEKQVSTETYTRQYKTRSLDNEAVEQSNVGQESTLADSTGTKGRPPTGKKVSTETHIKHHRKKRKKPSVNDDFLPLRESSVRKKKRALEQSQTRPLPLPPIGQTGGKNTSSDKP